MNKLWALLLPAIFITGCVATGSYKMNSTFNKNEAELALQPGENTVSGSALMRQRGGGVVTCAGSQVRLIPATAYATERMQVTYGNTNGGFADPSIFGTGASLPAAPVDYEMAMKVSHCNAQGEFKFQSIANGSYYLVTTIIWEAGAYNMQGGHLMRRIDVTGDVEDIVISY